MNLSNGLIFWEQLTIMNLVISMTLMRKEMELYTVMVSGGIQIGIEKHSKRELDF